MGRNKNKTSATRRERKKHSASKSTTPLNRLRGAIGDRKNWGRIHDALDSIKNDGSLYDYDRLFNLSAINPLTAIVIAASKPIKKTSRIQSVTPLDSEGIFKEIAWVVTLVSANSELLSKYVKLRNEYTLLLSKGHYEDAEKCLSKIDEECGFSLWVVENRISLVSHSGGFERQKSLVNSFLNAETRSFVTFFASNISERNESRVTKFSFESRLRERAKHWKIKLDQQTYIFYKLLGANSLTPLEAADILSFEAASSPIDLYETFIEVLIVIRDSLNPYLENVLIQLNKLVQIPDYCLENLKLMYSKSLPKTIRQAEYLNAFLSGEYQKAVELVQISINEEPENFLSILTAARLTAIGFPVLIENNSFISGLISQISEFLLHEGDSDVAAQSLERIAINFRCLPISTALNNLIHEASCGIFGDITASSAIRTNNCILPVLLELLDDVRKQELLESDNLHSALWLYEIISNYGDEKPIKLLSDEARDYAFISYNKKIDTPSNALSYLNQLSFSEIPFFKQESAILQAWFMYEEGNIEESIRHSINVAVSKPALLRSLPIISLFESRGFRDLKQLEKESCLSIGFFLYISLTRRNTKDVALKVAWKQFHKAHGLTKPSDIKDQIDKFNLKEILFFLRYVCTQEIMELSAAFNSPTDLDRERLQICILLSDIDAENSEVYDDEIIELTRRLSIEDGVQQVESSRIYVDLLGLQRWCHQNLNELYLRYLDYAGSGLKASADEIERSLIVIIKKHGIDFDLSNFLDSYDVSADSLLGELIEECATHFLTLPRFGLDAFLGSRVRHGSLEGAFRSPLENRKLITKIDSSTNQYETNVYWLNSVNGPSDQVQSLNKILNAFSLHIDMLLDSAISKYVYVKSTDNPEGIITLWPSDQKTRKQLLKAWLLSTKTSLFKEASIEQFVEYCAITFFWPQLKFSLSEAAEFITKTLAGRIHHELCVLEVEIQKLNLNYTGLPARINAAKTDIESAANKVSKWFAPPQFTNVDSSYLLKTGIEIGITSLRHIRPKFDNNVEWDVDERANVLLHPSAFQTINDVAFLIFGNIFKHSGFYDDSSLDEDRPKLKIWLRCKENDVVEVEVQNAISTTKNIVSIKENVNSAKEQIRLREYDSVAKKKSKTGLVRLASTLNYENSEDKIVDFGLLDDSIFFVLFAVPIYFLTGQSK